MLTADVMLLDVIDVPLLVETGICSCTPVFCRNLPNSIAIDCATYLKQYTGVEITAVQPQSASLSITLMQRR